MSLTSQNFVVIGVEAIAFLSDRTLSAPRLMATVLKTYADRFNGELQALPLPREIPAEVPRIILQSEDQQYRFEGAPARLKSSWQTTGEGKSELADIVPACVEVLAYCIRELNPCVGRLALVLSRVCSIAEPAQRLVEQFCNAAAMQQPLNRSFNFELHNHKQYTPTHPALNLPINSWVRCKSAALTKDNSPAILVEQDLNTLAEEADRHNFDAPKVEAYFEMAALEANSILGRYFPESNP